MADRLYEAGSWAELSETKEKISSDSLIKLSDFHCPGKINSTFFSISKNDNSAPRQIAELIKIH